MIAEPQTAAKMVFAVGEAVFLKGARFGLPGRVLRNERGKVVVYWGDLDHLSRHRPITLMLAEVKGACNGK